MHMLFSETKKLHGQTVTVLESETKMLYDKTIRTAGPGELQHEAPREWRAIKKFMQYTVVAVCVIAFVIVFSIGIYV